MSTPFLDAAQQIAAQLTRDALWHHDRCTWLGWSMDNLHNAWQPSYRSLDTTLYGGSAGVLLFLAHLHQHRPSSHLRRVLIGGLNQLLDTLPDSDPSPENPAETSYYSGPPGIAAALLQIAPALDDERLATRARDLLTRLIDAPLHPDLFDVLGGSAGLIPLLLETAAVTHDARFHDEAIRRGHHLLDRATRTPNGLAWHSPLDADREPLLGFSHGVAGVATALGHLAATTGETAFRDATADALRHERAHFSPAHQNWPDYRDMSELDPASAGQPAFPFAWCHGAPGIAVGRLGLLHAGWEDDQIHHEIHIACSQTLARLPAETAGSHCLCHGLMGNLDALLLAHETPGATHLDLLPHLQSVATQTVHHHATGQRPWPCGVLNAGETPNLLLGLAGIGHVLLRLALTQTKNAPPSVLLPYEQQSAAVESAVIGS